VTQPHSTSAPSPVTLAASTFPWYRTITRDQWRVLLAAKFGWMLDAMDFMIYAMAIGQLRAYFSFNDATAGMLGTVTLVMSAAGGVIFGFVADRVGRARALMITILIFSLASLGAATSQSLLQLLMWRAILGIGMGGEWASGAVLVSESWPAAHRNKAISIMQSGWALGYILAAIMAGFFIDVLELGNEGWRWLFAFGALPALFTLWVRRKVQEPAVWSERRRSGEPPANPFRVIFGSVYGRLTVLVVLLNSAVQFAYYGVFFWLPGFLARPVEQGGAGMGVVGSLAWIIPMQIGAYLGYLSFGFIADRLGRRRTFILFMVTAAILVPIYGQMARNPSVLMLLGPVLGFAGHGYFSMFGSFIAELFPTSVRATGQGASYNLGRLAGALGPYTIGALATLPGIGIGLALGSTSLLFLTAALLILRLPDKSGQELEK